MTGELIQPNWTAVLGPTLAALAVTAIIALISAATNSGGGLRLLSLVLLVAVMAQGVLGGLRVYLNALWGTDLALFHGVFSQVVLALATLLVVVTAPRRALPSVMQRGLITWAIIAAAIVFLQIIAGAVLRHTDSPLGPRLHLLGAFLVVLAIAAVSAPIPRFAGSRPRGAGGIAGRVAGSARH